jgi:hypothetical protein
MKVKRCRKHCWLEIEAEQQMPCDTSPGAINGYFGKFKFKICFGCHKLEPKSFNSLIGFLSNGAMVIG